MSCSAGANRLVFIGMTSSIALPCISLVLVKMNGQVRGPQEPNERGSIAAGLGATRTRAKREMDRL
jgi:hypothetical protein